MTSAAYRAVSEITPFPQRTFNERLTCHVFNKEFSDCVVCASSEGSLGLLDISRRLSIQSAWKPHSGCITDVALSKENTHIFLSSCRDGSIGIFDCRFSFDSQKTSRIQTTAEYQDVDLLSVAIGGSEGHQIVCGLDKTIPVYDLRYLTLNASYSKSSAMQRPVLTFESSHSDLINVVRFHPLRRSCVVSGADDNLIVVHDLTQPERYVGKGVAEDQDNFTSVVGVLNNQSPPRIFEFVGPHLNTISVITTIETICLWNSNYLFSDAVEPSVASCVRSFESEDHCATLGRICVGESFDVPLSQLVCNPLYVVNTFYDPTVDSLVALAGDFSGRLALYQIQSGSYSHIASFDPHVSHSDVVRSASLVHSSISPHMIATSGDDGRFMLWTRS